MTRTPVPPAAADPVDDDVIDLVDAVELSGPGGPALAGRPRQNTSNRLATVEPDIDAGVEQAMERITGNHAAVASSDSAPDHRRRPAAKPRRRDGLAPDAPRRPHEPRRSVPPRPTDSPEAALEGMFQSFYGATAAPSARGAENVYVADHTLTGASPGTTPVPVDTAPPKFSVRAHERPEPVANAILRDHFPPSAPVPGDTLVEGLPDARALMDLYVPPTSEAGLAATQPPEDDAYDVHVVSTDTDPGPPRRGVGGLDGQTEALLRDYLAPRPTSTRRRVSADPGRVGPRPLSTDELLAAYVSGDETVLRPREVRPLPPLPPEPRRRPEPLVPPTLQAPAPPPAPERRPVPPLPPAAPPPVYSSERAAPTPTHRPRRDSGVIERTSGVTADDEVRRSGPYRAITASRSGAYPVPGTSRSGSHAAVTASSSGVHRIPGAAPAEQAPPPLSTIDPGSWGEDQDTLELSDGHTRQVLQDAIDQGPTQPPRRGR